MVAALLSLVLFQDASTLADAVTERDPAASFRAISDLVDLADRRREEVEKEAGRLPAFYREVLLSELKAKRDLGDRFGRGSRLDLKGTGRRFWEYAEEVGRYPGMGVNLGSWLREKFPGEPMDVDLKDVWPLQALITLCDRSNFYIHGTWEGRLSIGDRGHPTFACKPPPWFFYRNIAIPQPAPRWRKLVDFGGPPRWRAILRISPTLGPETHVVMWKDLRVIEASMEDGTELKLAAPEDTAIPGCEWLTPSGVPEDMELAFDAGDKTGRTIGRLRCAVVGRVPRSWSRLVLDKLDGPDGGRAEDEDFEVTVRHPSPEDSPFVGNQPEVRIRPKKLSHAELSKVPVTIVFKWDMNGPYGTCFPFTGEGGSTLHRIWFNCTLRPAKDSQGEPIRRLLGLEVLIPMGLQDPPIFMEFRDIPLK